jgi:pimeloyl-ACP methyl ester carboxylesterase
VTTFALVHGAWHGAWCWARVTPLLERRGHRVVAPDLPSEDPAATFDDYAGVVIRALADAGDDVVVVGHSLAGNTIPLVAARRPVRRLVYLCALIASPGVSFGDDVRAEPDMFVAGYERGLAPPDEQRRRVWADYAVARETMFSDCPEADAQAAFARLRPQASAPYREPCSLDSLPDVPATYVVAAGTGSSARRGAAVRRRSGSGSSRSSSPATTRRTSRARRRSRTCSTPRRSARRSARGAAPARSARSCLR